MAKITGGVSREEWTLTTITDLMKSDDIRLPRHKREDTKENYLKILQAICMQAITGETLNIDRFCKENGINPGSFYMYLGYECTEKIIDRFIQRVVVANKPDIYTKLKSVYQKRPGFASLYHRRYEGWVPEEKHTGTLTVVFPWAEKAKISAKQTEVAEFEDLPKSEDGDNKELTKGKKS